MNSDAIIFDSALIADREYWLRELTSEPWHSPIVAWPPEAKQSWKELRLTVDEETNTAIGRLAGDSQLLRCAILLGALGICGSRYCGHPTMAIATPSLKGARPNLLPVLVSASRQSSV